MSIVPMTQQSNIVDITAQTVGKLSKIETELQSKFFEREQVIADLIRAVISETNILLLGPVGTAKSDLAREFMSHVIDSRFFYILLNKSTQPDELFGPVSMKGMENDEFIRISKNLVPDASLVFADEMFKSNLPVLNLLLPVINEKVWYVQGEPKPVKLLTMIGASNEEPNDPNYDAIFDRMVFRHVVHNLKDDNNFANMISNDIARRSVHAANPKTLVSIDEIQRLISAKNHVAFPALIVKILTKLRRALSHQGINVSERRWVMCARIMQANAILKGRMSVSDDDLSSITNVLAHHEDRLQIVKHEIGSLINPLNAEMKRLIGKVVTSYDTIRNEKDELQRTKMIVASKQSFNDAKKKAKDIIDQAKEQGRDTTELQQQADKIQELQQALFLSTIQ